MDFGLDLSSRIVDRIDHDLFSGDSDDFSLPGMSRRASVLGQSYADQSVSTSRFGESGAGSLSQRRDVPRAPAESPSAEMDEQDTLAVDIHDLDRRLLHDSQSLRWSQAEQDKPDDSHWDNTSHNMHTSMQQDTSSGAQFMQESGQFSLHDTDAEASDASSSSSLPMDSPSMSQRRSTSPKDSPAKDLSSLSKRQGSFRRREGTTTPPSHPSTPYTLAAESTMYTDASRLSAASSTQESSRASAHEASDASHQDAEHTSGPSTDPSHSADKSMQVAEASDHRSTAEPPHVERAASPTYDTSVRSASRSALPPHFRASHDDSTASDVLTVPNHARFQPNRSMPQLGEEDAHLASHIDPHRLIVYQDKLNQQLAAENEALKLQCDALLQIVQAHNVPVDLDQLPMDVSRHSDVSGALKDTSASAEANGQETDERGAPKPRGTAPPDAAPAAAVRPEGSTPPVEAHLRRRIQDLEAVVEEQHRRLHLSPTHTPPPPDRHTESEWAVLDRTTEAVQEQHERLLDQVASGTDLHACVEQLRTALTQAHGLLNAMRASKLRTSTSLSMSHGRASVSMDAEEALEELGPLHATVRTLTHELQRVRTSVHDAAVEASEASARKHSLEDQLRATRTELASTETSLQEKVQSLRAVREEYLERSQAPSKPTEVYALEEELAHAQDEVRTLEAKHAQTERRLRILDEQHAAVIQRADEAEHTADLARKARLECEARLDAQIEQVHAMHDALALRNEEVEHLRGEKDRLWEERTQIMEQVQRFEQHLRQVRHDTKQYGDDLRVLRQEKETLLATQGVDADAVRRQIAQQVKPRLDALYLQLEEERMHRSNLVTQKAYLSRALQAQEWLYDRLGRHLNELAPVLAKYGLTPRPAPRLPRLRAVVWVVRLALRWGT